MSLDKSSILTALSAVCSVVSNATMLVIAVGRDFISAHVRQLTAASGLR